MIERALPLRDWQVRGILDGRMSEIRLPVKPQPVLDGSLHSQPMWRWSGGPYLRRATYGAEYVHSSIDAVKRAMVAACRYGRSGDRLWVQETWQPIWATDEAPLGNGPDGWAISYPATDGIKEYVDDERGITSACRSSTQMPRWASRITLEVTSVDVDRLRMITTEQALAEGMPGPRSTLESIQEFPKGSIALRQYRDTWDSIYAKRPGLSWDDGPWVWIIGFRRIES